MKHLISINEYKSESYQKVSQMERSELYDKKSESFSDREMEFLKNCNNWYKEFYMLKIDNIFVPKQYTTVQFRDVSYGPPKVKFFISKYEDEWFSIEFYDSIRSHNYEVTCYICDQFEGVRSFLKEKIHNL